MPLWTDLPPAPRLRPEEQQVAFMVVCVALVVTLAGLALGAAITPDAIVPCAPVAALTK